MGEQAEISFRSDAVEEAARLITERFGRSAAFTYPMRFALAIGQRASYRDVPMATPSLDVGVNDGSTASIIHYGKPRITWGGDMPEESTYESMGLFVSPEYNVYDNLVGFDVSSEVPFNDESFNSVSATEVFSYGVDRDRTLSELVRVLAPGGTIAFSDNSEAILQFAAIRDGLKEYVTTLNVLEDSRAWYTSKLRALGLVDIQARLYFNKNLAALLHSLMYSADPTADHDHHRRLLTDDPRLRRFYTDGLLAIAAHLDEEFAGDERPTDGWHVFVAGRKPGELDQSLSVPQPRCPTCRAAGELERSLTACRCRQCGREYLTRFGVPYLLRDPSAVYSPKRARPAHLSTERRLDERIVAVLRASSPLLREAGPLALTGVDPTTAFTLRVLRELEVPVSSVHTSNPDLIGLDVDGVRISAVDGVDDMTLLLSAYPGADVEWVDPESYRSVYSIALGSDEGGVVDWPAPKRPPENTVSGRRGLRVWRR